MAFCKNCGQSMDPHAAVCMQCGFAAGTGHAYCPNCGKETLPGAFACTNCGVTLQESGPQAKSGQEQKSRLTAGLLGIFLGAFGIHNFYLERMNIGAIQVAMGAVGVLLSCCTGGISLGILVASGVWGLVEGILILIGHTKTDGKGNPLK